NLDTPPGLRLGALHAGAFTNASGEISAGQSIQIAISFAGAVGVTGAPKLNLNTGAVATYDVAASNPATGSLVFDYTVGMNERAANLAVLGVDLAGGSIKDS